MERYEKYKDSGVEWIGEIPEGWAVKKFKYLYALITDKSDLDLPKIGLENIESETGKFITSNTDFEGGGIHFKINDILFGKLRPYLAKVYLAEFEGKAIGDFYVFRCENEIDARYSSNLILSKPFIDLSNSSTFGSKMPRVAWDIIANFKIAYPSLTEQTTIANYLDHKTTEIDQLITQKEHLLSLYEEEKTAIINQAVTQGITPDVKLKESGIDWLGDIPEHWEVKKLKYIANLKSGSNLTSEQIKQDGDFQVYGGNGLRGCYKNFTHDGNFVLIGRQGALCGNIHYAKKKFWATDH
ncbi:MAG TPA: restriction endonuclease subunit S, partial [Leucothrix sp.]|nr:restriction endonuclease subunit S [Leucothrix sp.]